MGSVLDFDRARSEGGDPPVLRAFGRDWAVPSSVPVGFTLYSNELQHRRPDGNITTAEGLELLQHAVGRTTYEGLIAEGLEPDDVDLLLGLIGEEWRKAAAEEEGDQGEAPAPAEGATGSAT